MTAGRDNWLPGMQVRLIHNPLRIGMLTDAEPRVRKNRKLYQVRFPDQVDRVYEDQLEPLPEERMSPLDLLADGKLGTRPGMSSSQMKYSLALISAASTVRLVSFGMGGRFSNDQSASRHRARPPVEALWKQEGENRCASLRKPKCSARR
jgi:hypothetical protein